MVPRHSVNSSTCLICRPDFRLEELTFATDKSFNSVESSRVANIADSS